MEAPPGHSQVCCERWRTATAAARVARQPVVGSPRRHADLSAEDIEADYDGLPSAAAELGSLCELSPSWMASSRMGCASLDKDARCETNHAVRDAGIDCPH